MRIVIASSKGPLKEYEVTLADHGHHLVQTVMTRTRRTARGRSTEFFMRLVPTLGEVWNRAVAAAKELSAAASGR